MIQKYKAKHVKDIEEFSKNSKLIDLVFGLLQCLNHNLIVHLLWNAENG